MMTYAEEFAGHSGAAVAAGGWRSNASQGSTVAASAADAGPLLAAPPSGPSAAVAQGAADSLRRVLSVPWHALRRGASGTQSPNGDRSGHIHGAFPSVNRSNRHRQQPTSNDPSHSSHASGRSLFDVDGMPERALHGTSAHSICPDGPSPNGPTAVTVTVDPSGSGHCQPLWLLSVAGSGTGGVTGGTYSGSGYRRNQQTLRTGDGIPVNATSSSSSVHRLGARSATPDRALTPEPSPLHHAHLAAHEGRFQPHPAHQPYAHPFAPMPPPSAPLPDPFPRLLAPAAPPPPGPRPQTPPSPLRSLPDSSAHPDQSAHGKGGGAGGGIGASAGDGTGALGIAAFGGSGSHVSGHGPPADHSAHACGAGGGCGAVGPNGLPWDDARNPMSLYYNPALDGGVPGYGGGARGGEASWPPAAAGAKGPWDAREPPTAGARERREALAATISGIAPPSPNYAPAVPNKPSDGVGGDGYRPLEDEPEFVVLDMKERASPSIRQAAAAAVASGASASPAAPDAAAAAAALPLTLRGRMASYFGKWAGVGDTMMPADSPIDVFWSWLGAFLSILAVALLHQYLTPHISLPLMIASFGASAVLLFGVPASKLAQPRNFLGGQVISAVVGVLVRLAFFRAPHLVWLSAALGMSLSLAAMQLTRTTHPPGGASALIASSLATIGPWYGFKFVLTVLFGCVVMMCVALLVNNLSARRRYPTYWLGA